MSLRPATPVAPVLASLSRARPLLEAPRSPCAQDRDSLVYQTGVMKLADFGLSKTLPQNKHAGFDLESKFKLTGETGSYRYMAPEVFRHEPYNFKARCCSQPPGAQHCPPWLNIQRSTAAVGMPTTARTGTAHRQPVC